MKTVIRRLLTTAGLAAALSLLLLLPSPAPAYVEAPHSLGQIVALSSHIVLMRVSAVDRKTNSVIFAKVRDIKGKHGQTEIRHRIGTAGFEPREWQTVMNWAEVGREAVMFHNGSQSETCIGHYWHQTYGNHADVNGWWGMVHGEPYLLRAYSGKVDKLVTAVEAIMAGKEVIVSSMIGTNDDMKGMKGKIQRVKASLKLDYNPKRDFVGWGGEDFRRIAGMPGFTHFSGIARVDPDAQSVSVVDFNGDGKTDVVLSGGSRVALLQNGGEALGEMSLPGVSGSRASVWGDYNGDGLPDLLIGAGTGPRLFTNLGKNEFRDDSHLLPKEPGYNVTCAAWIDQDGDGRPDVLLGNGWHGLRLYRNAGVAKNTAPIVLEPWRYIGPFPNAGRGFATAYPPEKEINYKGLYDGKGDKVTWKEGKFTDGAVNSFTGLFAANNDAVCYVHREITCAKPAKLPISLGSDDGMVVWLNGKQLVSVNTARACTPDQHRITLDLKEGRNDLLIKIVQGDGDWAYYFNPLEKLPSFVSWSFKDVSEEVGLGEKGVGGDIKGDSLTVCDLDGNGKADFIYAAGTGVVVKNDGKAFSVAKDSGLNFRPGRGGPVIGDFDADGKPDLLIAAPTGLTLFKNEGGFKFKDVTKGSGLEGLTAACAAWGDVDNDGKLDVVVGRLRATNVLLRGKGDGTFDDATAKVGLNQRVFNTQAAAVADINGDGVPDVVFSNEGQDSCVLLGNPEAMAKRTPVTLTLGAKSGLTGGRVLLKDMGGKLLAAAELTGGEGRGGQALGTRFALEPGSYRVELLLSSGEKREKELTVAATHLKAVVE